MKDSTRSIQTPIGGIDPAALAVAVFAGALSVFAPQGPYSPGSILTGLTLLFVILGYDVNPHRNLYQSIAYGAVFGLVCILIIGYPLEILWADDKVKRLHILFKEIPSDDEQKFSSIPPLAILVLWVLLSAAMCSYDRYRAKQSQSTED
jgi:hypothetical protein